MKYLALRGYSTACKNNLERQIEAYLKDIDRVLIDEIDIEHVKQKIIDKIHVLNAQNRRCDPSDPYWYTTDQGKTICLHGKGIRSSFKLLQGRVAEL